MEPNVRFWITERQSFFQRFLQWTELLDPTNLVISVEKIEKSRQLLLTNEDAFGSLEDQRIQEAWKRSLSTVHPDNSKLIPVPFRPAALLPFTAPMVFLSLVSAKSLKAMVLPQLSFFTYTTTFNVINGNASYDCRPYESILLGAGVIASSTFLGLLPRLFQVRYSLNNVLVRRALPVIVLTQVSAMNVVVSRGLEPMRGIEVMDKEGNVIGYSRKAGTKYGGFCGHSAQPQIAHGSLVLGVDFLKNNFQQAVKDTAATRAVLFGTSAAIPEVFSYFFKRTQFFLQYPWSLWSFKLSCTILVMGLMVPVSLSIFPQIGRIQCSKLEKEIQSATEETELFYNRGI